ncbi:MAG: hypothetical protein KJ939_04215 [Nanoarchaeota archaeon]|nr:hypothetical protein [Nanoarchaeota archaeon]
MKLSKTELKVISELGKGNNNISNIAQSLKISISQVYRIVQKLSKKDILKLSKGILQPKMKTHINLLLKLMAKTKNLASPLSSTGISIYTTITTTKTIKEIEEATDLHKTTVIKKLNQGKKMSLISLKNKRYSINEKLWPEAKEFFEELKKYDETIDERVPVNSIIYHKNDKEIVFSNKEEIVAQKTAFSGYKNYGIKLLLTTNYYYLPKKKLNKKEIFQHSLYVTEKEKNIRHIIFLTLFYLKFKKEIKKIKSQLLQDIISILNGNKIKGFPTIEEIKEKAKVYEIKI